jgi:hypothetical protein
MRPLGREGFPAGLKDEHRTPAALGGTYGLRSTTLDNVVYAFLPAKSPVLVT